MSANKTTETASSVDDFINAVADEVKRTDCFELILLLNKLTALEAKMWGSSIVGFGSYHYKYESGREGDSPLVAFSPRASSIALYLSGHFDNRAQLLEKLGKHKTDKGCIHIKKLADVDMDTLAEMVRNHIKHIKEVYPVSQ
jgi:Domain of unknown function (DU1801)